LLIGSKENNFNEDPDNIQKADFITFVICPSTIQ